MLRFLFLSLFVFCSLSQAQTFTDKHIYPVLERGSDRHSGVTFLAGALASFVARPNDDYVRSEWMKNQKVSESDSQIGDVIGSGVGGGLVIGAQYFFDPYETNYQSHLRGMVYGGISIYALKTFFGRNRPGNSDSHQSFPSGHTTITFMSATHLMYAYGWKAAVIAYPIAAFTGITRLADDAHWFSDIIGGAFLGYLVGRATYYDYDQIKNGNQTSYQLIPIFKHDLQGFSFVAEY